MVWAAIGAVGGALVQGILGAIGARQQAESEEAYRARLAKLEQELMSKPLPELKEIAYETLGPSAVESIISDPEMQARQKRTLGVYDELVKRGGLMESDLAALNKLQRQASLADKARRSQITQQMASRGMRDAGLGWGMQLRSAQDAAGRDYQAGMDLAGQAQQRVMQALIEQGRLAGNIDETQYQRNLNAARAKDAIVQYNNALRARAADYNAGLDQKRWENWLKQYNARAGLQGQQGAIDLAQGQRGAASMAGLGSAAGSVVNYLGGALEGSGGAKTAAQAPASANLGNYASQLNLGTKTPDTYESPYSLGDYWSKLKLKGY